MGKARLVMLMALAMALCIIPAYATVMETSAPLRDKLPAETLAEMPSFIEEMQTVGSQVSFAPQGHYAIYNEQDLRGIFGEDALIMPSGGLVLISYMRSGAYRYWGALHGLIIADSMRKAITITKGGFISSEEVGVNIAGDEVVIDARNPARSAFKVSREGVYNQYGYFAGCKPESAATAEDCELSICADEFSLREAESGELCRECTYEEMREYEEQVKKQNYCELRAVAAPQYAYVNVTGSAFASESGYLNYYRTALDFDDFRDTVYDGEGFLIEMEELRNMQIEEEESISFTASAPAGAVIMDTSRRGGRVEIKSSELFRYSRQGEYNHISGNRLKLYYLSNVVVEGGGIGDSQRAESSVRIFKGDLYGAYEAEKMSIKDGGVYFSGQYQDQPCPQDIQSKWACFSSKSDYDEMTGGVSYYYKLQASYQNPVVADINAETLSAAEGRTITDVLVDMDTFIEGGSSSKIRLADNAGTAVEFTRDDIIVTPPDRSWTELGVSFKGYVFSQDGLTMDIIECRYNEGKCYLNGVESLGFIGGRVQRSVLCINDDVCSSNQKCVEGHCVQKATCGSVESAGRMAPLSASLPNKANVIFISDGYDSKEQFGRNIKKVISNSESENGIFSVEPFKSNIEKFGFYYAFGGNAPSVFGHEGMAPWERYVNSFVKQCPSAEYAVVLTQKDFRAFAETGRTGIAEKGIAWVSVGAKPERFSEVALHEFGHAFGDLRDEYYMQREGEGGRIGNPNCLSKDDALLKWEAWPEILADAEQEKWKSCGGDCDPSQCASLLRPSENSVMNDPYAWLAKRNEPGWKAFNEPSEKQLREKLDEYS